MRNTKLKEMTKTIPYYLKRGVVALMVFTCYNTSVSTSFLRLKQVLYSSEVARGEQLRMIDIQNEYISLMTRSNLLIVDHMTRLVLFVWLGSEECADDLFNFSF